MRATPLIKSHKLKPIHSQLQWIEVLSDISYPNVVELVCIR